jgi:hypothetical protein
VPKDYVITGRSPPGGVNILFNHHVEMCGAPGAVNTVFDHSLEISGAPGE